MEITLVETPWTKLLLGQAGRHDRARSYGDEIRELLNPVWESVRRDQLAVTGINHVFYGEQDEIFCGVEFKGEPRPVSGLELRRIVIDRYLYYRHTGPYEQIPDAYARMRAEAGRRGEAPVSRSLEIYGHWNEDPGKLETEILIGLARPS